MTNEIWKTIRDYEGYYEVSSLGNVKSLGNTKTSFKEVILKPHIPKDGYPSVLLSKKSKRKNNRIHKLVAMAFLGESKMHVNHIDGNKLNNKVDNLELVSHRENNCHNKINIQKTSKYIGVYWEPVRGKFVSSIKIQGKSKSLGRFDDEYKAHLAYVNALNKYGIQNKYATVSCV